MGWVGRGGNYVVPSGYGCVDDYELLFDEWPTVCWSNSELMKETDEKGFPRKRRSACAEASLRAEIERVKKMSDEERGSAALNMGKVFDGDLSVLSQGKTMSESDIEDALLEAATIASILSEEGIECVLIGAIALAVHRYIRHTQDVDLGVNADLKQMKRLAEVLDSRGYDAVFHEPDGDDPLGGVIDITGSFGMVQIVSFENRFPAAIRDALADDNIRTLANSKLRVIPIPQLVALKLYAGGWKSLSDVVEMLRRNPEVDLKEVGEVCQKYRIRGWEKVMEELGVE